MAAGQEYSRHVVTRLLDFFDDSSHWQRRLWNVGLALALNEVIEASEAMRDRALSTAAVNWLTACVKDKVADDPGAGSREQRLTLMAALKGAPAADGADHRLIRVSADDITREYLRRWRDDLASNASPPGRERTARAIAAHMLDSGLPGTYLRAWLADLLKQQDSLSVVELLDNAISLHTKPPRTFEVVAMFHVEPRSRAKRPAQWVDSRVVAEWLRANSLDTSLRQRGGLLLRVEAFDEHDAARRARDVIDQFCARVIVGTRSTAAFYPEVAVAGAGMVPVQAGRRVEVRALEREDLVYEIGRKSIVDPALELLSQLDVGAPAPAVAGGWSAIEILLSGPGDTDKVIAGERLAVLVACSWPRAELTDLAWSWARQFSDALAAEISDAQSNHERANAIAKAIETGATLTFKTPSDAAALHRMESLFQEPRRLLLDVKNHVGESFRRLYRQRNLVMHGGRVEAVALEAALRTSAPLVGAGVDRIVHAHLTEKLHPLQLLARGQFELERASSSSGKPLVGMLE